MPMCSLMDLTINTVQKQKIREMEEDLAKAKKELAGQPNGNHDDDSKNELERIEAEREKFKKLYGEIDFREGETSTLQLHRLLIKSQIEALDKSYQVHTEKKKAEEDRLALQNELTQIKSELETFKKGKNNVREGQYYSSLSDNIVVPNYCQFTLSELEDATGKFAKKNMVGVGEYSSVYKGSLCHTEFAIKKQNFETRHGVREFIQEVEILSRIRHPNLITLIGACEEARALVYEYLPNGSLEDRLHCKDKTPPLSWQNRLRIALDVCSALIFLHSAKPHGIAHGDLKPSNILLDSNYRSKVSDFGCGRPLIQDSSITFTPHHVTNHAHGTLAYLDPEYLSTGMITTYCDVYSFGLVLLQLVTGKGVKKLRKSVEAATENVGVNSLVDHSGGEWPQSVSMGMIRLGLRCSEASRDNRLDLSKEVWESLNKMETNPSSTSGILRWISA